MLTKQAVMYRMCALASKVCDEVFDYKYASDCFCGANNLMEDCFRFDEVVLEFIEKAVMDSIYREKS